MLNQRDIIICLRDEWMLYRFGEFISRRESLEILSDTFPFGIKIIRAVPIFLTEKQILELKKEGVRVPDVRDVPYTIYLHDGIQEPIERLAGVEFPGSILYDYPTFKNTLLRRIRTVVGSPIDN